MRSLSASDLLSGLKKALDRCGVDYEQIIKEFGQVAAAEERSGGRSFALRDHVRGLIFSQLSNQRPWKTIAQNRERIGRIFHDFDPNALDHADPMHLEMNIRAIRCGNRAIRNQVNALGRNITTLRRIERDFGSLDKFVTSGDPNSVARQISEPGPYKLVYVGYALALEYLKNVGIRAGKPDLHVLRVLGGERLSYFPGRPSQQQAVHLIASLAAEAKCNATYLDNLLWLFCARGYGQVCGASPSCNICAFPQNCHYPTASSMAPL
jgi:hypothetical protein